ncbi:expressed unknown protein [Seminavis robusta]|uniref:Uncharacterized protein n=1 Tax=Seminavis robusta TaxID=568900 RepID=A0A9N8H3E1_9STRA|nr:expressed unknown protein [Seminavis robusta]|eukprot:Sro37_g023190.1 n/a (701) ;mRNA; f:53347-55694
MDFFEAHEEDESSEEIDLLGNSSRLDTGQPDNTKSNAMDFFGTHEDESTEEIDLLGSSSHETSAKDEKKVDSKVVQQQAMQHATPLGTEPVKKTPRSASLLFKLDELERQWTHQDVSTNKNNNPPERNPIDNLNLFVPQSTAPFSPYANSEISPITWGNSPMMVSVDHGAKLDDDSISTFGSLGSPGIGFAPAPKQLFGQNMTSTARQLQGGHRQSNDDQKPARKPSLFDRLHRGEKRATSATPKNPPTSTTKSVRKLVFGTPNNKKPPTPKPTTSGKPKKAFIFMQRKSKVMPLPPPTSTIPVSQQPTAHSLPQTQRSGSGSASNKKSVFDRLYRNERRSTNLWRDPGAKWGEKYQFIAAGGAAKTSMIPLAGIPATPGVKRKLFLPLSPVPSSPENKKLACLLQNAWRYRQAHSQLIGKLAQQWSVTCYPTDGTVTANRILRLRLGIQARAVAIRRADLSSMGKGTTVGEQEVSFETIQEICFQAWDDDEHVLQKYSVHVQCQAKMIQLLRTWRPEKLAFLLYKCALELSTEYETNNLMHAAAGLLQQWFFSFARKQALSCDDGNNTPQERQQLQSLNWFRNRLEREAGPAVWARFDDAATVIQAAFRMFSAKRYLDLNYSSLAVYRTRRESRQRLREGASLKIQALYRGHHVRRRLGSSTAGIIVEAWTQRKNATKAICVVQSYVRMILKRLPEPED